MTGQVLTIDSQVHAYERDSPERPWQGFLDGPDEVTGDDMVAAMDAVGVDGALLVSPYSMYRYDASYALEVYAKHPGKFGLIRPFNPESETIDEDMAEWTSTPGVVGARIMLTYGDYNDGSHPGLNAIAAAAGRAGVPVNIMSTNRMHVVAEIARRNPNTQLVIDHVGLEQPRHPPAPSEPWAGLDDVLAVAAHDNVAIKISGACTLAQQPFPYPDIWGAARQNVRGVRLRAMSVGHRLDARDTCADLRAGRRGVPRHRRAIGLRARHANGRRADESL